MRVRLRGHPDRRIARWTCSSASTSGRRSPRRRWWTARRGGSLGTASHATTIDTDVLDGFEACREELARTHPSVAEAEVLACSSAGGGLRVAVIGNEELVTAEAGRRVALSSGGKVVAVLEPCLRRGGLPRPGAARRDRTWCCSPVAPTGATRTACSRPRPGWPAAAGSAPWSWPATARRRSRGHGRPGRLPGRRGGQRGAEDRGAGARLRTPGHPRGLPRARDRGQAAEQPGRLPGDGARCHARPGAHGGRGPRASQCPGRRGPRHRRGDHRRALGGPARPRGRSRALARGRGEHAADAHGGGRPRHAVERYLAPGRPASRPAWSATISVRPPNDVPPSRRCWP